MTKTMTMTFQDTMITLAGYQSETHKVVTPDGYILTLYRLAMIRISIAENLRTQ